jgi:DNA-binding HxlR family transcriptional regulator
LAHFLNLIYLVQKVNQNWYSSTMTTVNYQKHNCPIAQALVELGDQWTLLIVRDALLAGRCRFNEFRESLGISRNLLTVRLSQLCEAGILERVQITNSKRYAYVPTQKCQDLRIIILAMAKWGEKWGTDPHIHRLELREKITGHPVTVEFYQTEDGKAVDPDNVRVLRQGNGKLEDEKRSGCNLKDRNAPT